MVRSDFGVNERRKSSKFIISLCLLIILYWSCFPISSFASFEFGNFRIDIDGDSTFDPDILLID